MCFVGVFLFVWLVVLRVTDIDGRDVSGSEHSAGTDTPRASSAPCLGFGAAVEDHAQCTQGQEGESVQPGTLLLPAAALWQ